MISDSFLWNCDFRLVPCMSRSIYLLNHDDFRDIINNESYMSPCFDWKRMLFANSVRIECIQRRLSAILERISMRRHCCLHCSYKDCAIDTEWASSAWVCIRCPSVRFTVALCRQLLSSTVSVWYWFRVLGTVVIQNKWWKRYHFPLQNRMNIPKIYKKIFWSIFCENKKKSEKIISTLAWSWIIYNVDLNPNCANSAKTLVTHSWVCVSLESNFEKPLTQNHRIRIQQMKWKVEELSSGASVGNRRRQR